MVDDFSHITLSGGTIQKLRAISIGPMSANPNTTCKLSGTLDGVTWFDLPASALIDSQTAVHIDFGALSEMAQQFSKVYAPMARWLGWSMVNGIQLGIRMGRHSRHYRMTHGKHTRRARSSR